MTAREIISNLQALAPADSRDFFLYIANHVAEARLEDGQRLNDATDFIVFLQELAEATDDVFAEQYDRALSAVNKIDDALSALNKTCPRCGHLHEGDRECGAFIGGGRVCRCEMEVPA
jgi:hypothetical protein